MKRRIKNVLRWRKPRLWKRLAAVLLCAAALTVCSLNPSPVRGAAVSGVEDYAGERLADIIGAEVPYRSLSAQAAGAEDPCAAAAILDARTEALEKVGELDGMASGGVLELWHFQYRIKLAVDDPADVALPDGGCEQDGWFDLAGQGGNYIIALHREKGDYEILDSGGWNGGEGFCPCRAAAAEVLSDWYLTAVGAEPAVPGESAAG